MALAVGSMTASLLVVLLKRSFPMLFVQYARTNSILARLHAFALSITNRAGLARDYLTYLIVEVIACQVGQMHSQRRNLI